MRYYIDEHCKINDCRLLAHQGNESRRTFMLDMKLAGSDVVCMNCKYNLVMASDFGDEMSMH